MEEEEPEEDSVEEEVDSEVEIEETLEEEIEEALTAEADDSNNLDYIIKLINSRAFILFIFLIFALLFDLQSDFFPMLLNNFVFFKHIILSCFSR